MPEPTPRAAASSFLLLPNAVTQIEARQLWCLTVLPLTSSRTFPNPIIRCPDLLELSNSFWHQPQPQTFQILKLFSPSVRSKDIKPCSVAGTFWTGVTFWCMSTAAASPSSTVKSIALCEDRREGTRRTLTNLWASSRFHIPRIYKCDPVRILSKEIKTTKQ